MECFAPCRVHGRGVPGGVFCPYRVDRRVGHSGVFCPVQGSWERSACGRVLPRAGFIVEECPDDNGGSVFCRAGFIGEEDMKECFSPRIGLIGEECLMTIEGVLCVVQGSSSRSTRKSVFSFSVV